jgi:hypothetical protein
MLFEKNHSVSKANVSCNPENAKQDFINRVNTTTEHGLKMELKILEFLRQCHEGKGYRETFRRRSGC